MSGFSRAIQKLTSNGATVTISDPAGPVTDLAVSTPAPAAATTVTGPDAYGAAPAVGTGTSFAREDHDHGLPSAPSPALTYQQSILASNVTLTTAGTFYEVLSLSLPAGTWLINVTADLNDAGTTGGTSVVMIGPNSASATGIYKGARQETGDASGAIIESTISFSYVLVLAVTTTVYVNAAGANNSATVRASASLETSLTLINAVKIA